MIGIPYPSIKPQTAPSKAMSIVGLKLIIWIARQHAANIILSKWKTQMGGSLSEKIRVSNYYLVTNQTIGITEINYKNRRISQIEVKTSAL